MSLRSGQNNKKPIHQEQYNQERGFETYLHGANEQRVQVKRLNERSSDPKNVSKERKKWQEQQQIQQIIHEKSRNQQEKVEASRQKWNKLPPSKEDSNNINKLKQQQNISKRDGEQIVNYIQTMDKDELEMLRQSLIGQNMQIMRKGNFSPSPNKAMMVEEDEDLKNQKYYQNEDDQEDHNDDDEEEDYNDEAFDNIEEDIQDNIDNQSGLYNYQPAQNDRSYQGYNLQNNNNNKQQVISKVRPISAIESNKYNQNLYGNNAKNYESSHNIGKFDSSGYNYGQRKQSEDVIDQQRGFMYNEETKQLNTNPFNLKKVGKINTENKPQQQQSRNTNYDRYKAEDADIPIHISKNIKDNTQEGQQPQSEVRDRGLEDLFIKLSKMNEGVRSELATLIDKIGNGELDVSAIKSLLFMQNNNSNQSLNTNQSSKSELIKDSQHNRMQSEPVQQISHQKFKQEDKHSFAEKNDLNNYQDNLNVRRDLFGEEEAKPETIKFSRDQFSISLSKGLLQNTQELEKTLNFGNNFDQNVDKQDKRQSKNEVSLTKQQNDDNYEYDIDIDSDKQNNKHNQDKKGVDQQNYDEDEYFEEEEVVEEEDEPVNQKFYNRLNQNKLKDTLQRKHEKEGDAFCKQDIKKAQMIEEPSSEISTKKSETKSVASNQESNKTFNLAKKEKQIQAGLKDVKEQKGEVFIIIRVISTWGSVHLVGLTEIKVYDEEGTNIKLKPDDFMIEGGAQTSLRNINRICDGVYDTVDSEHMWQGTMPDPPKCMEIGIRFKSLKGFGAIKIWNYNKSLIDSVKGIKEIEITRRNKLIWAGQIKKGLGKEHENYGDVIKFKEDITLDDDKLKVQVRNSQQQGVIPPKASVNQSKEIKGNLKSDEKAIPSYDPQIKLQQKKSILSLDDNETNKQGRQRGSNLPSSASSSNVTPTARIRSSQQKTSNIPLSKENDESDTQTQTTASTSNLKKNIEARLGKEVETDSLSKAVQAKMSVQKSVSLVPKNKNNDFPNNQSIQSATSHNPYVGLSNFESSKSKQKLDDSKNLSSQSTSDRAIQNHIQISTNTQLLYDPFVDQNTTKSIKKGPKVMNIFDEKQQKGTIQSSTSLSNKGIIQSDSPAQKRVTQTESQKDKMELNFDKIEQDMKKKSSDDSNNGKGDDFMEHVKFFNATHQGRFQAAERERMLQNQANDVQEAVKQTLQSLNPLFQNNMGKKGMNEENNLQSEDDSGEYNSKIDIFMKDSIKLQQHLTSSITKSQQQKQSQIKTNKPIKTVLEDDDWILDQILRDETTQNEPSQASKNKQQDIFAPKKPQTSKGLNNEDTKLESQQFTQKKEISSNLDDTNIFQNELNKLLESKNEPFLADILKSVQKDAPIKSQQQPLEFMIPSLPEGRNLKIEIYNTWGDSHYVGLSGIEFFDARGNPITINNGKKQVRADPSDINILPEYGEDPRTCDKLVDGHYLTCDDLHMWLAPYQQGRVNYIYIDFLQVQKISMIRFWNYNKSRIHSFRGAKDIQIMLDDKPIFAGPISRAQGSQYYAPKDCEYIMFTDKENILLQIEKSDWLNAYQFTEIEEEQNAIEKMLQTQTLQRPLTGNNNNIDSQTSLSSQPRSLTGKDGRPITSAKNSNQYLMKEEDLDKRLNSKANQVIEHQMKQSQNKSLKRGVKCSFIKINILKSWEDKFYVGLTGIEIYDDYGQKIPLKENQIKARPKDLNDISGINGDQRTLDKLVDGVNITTNEKHMWLVQLLETPQNYIQINLQEERVISGIKIWNYNKQVKYCDSKSVEANRGAKIISITANDSIQLTPSQGIILRKAPGRDLFDYGQMIALPFQSGWTPEVIQSLQLPTQVNNIIIQEYDTIYLPRGFCVRINIHSTWGDVHYCGLNGIEFYDSLGNPIIEKKLAEFKLGAEPASINILPGCQGDIRTIDKLVNCQNDTFDDRNMWLAPFINSHNDKNIICPHLKMNTIYVYFEKPVIISAISFWNYSKTPSRGVREIEIFLDDKLIFRGYLKKAPTQEQYNKDSVPLYNTVVFNRNQEILKKIKPVVYNEDKLHQNVIFHNEGKVDENNKNQVIQQQLQVPNKVVNPLERPSTKVSGMKILQN